METKDRILQEEYLSRINKVIDYIETHIDQPLTLAKIADIACFSSFHFHRVFTLLKGETPMNFIQRRRMEKAVHLLRNDRESTITEIAYRCGYSSLSLFSRTFRKVYGMTAREFKESDKRLLSKDSIHFLITERCVS